MLSSQNGITFEITPLYNEFYNNYKPLINCKKVDDSLIEDIIYSSFSFAFGYTFSNDYPDTYMLDFISYIEDYLYSIDLEENTEYIKPFFQLRDVFIKISRFVNDIHILNTVLEDFKVYEVRSKRYMSFKLLPDYITYEYKYFTTYNFNNVYTLFRIYVPELSKEEFKDYITYISNRYKEGLDINRNVLIGLTLHKLGYIDSIKDIVDHLVNAMTSIDTNIFLHFYGFIHNTLICKQGVDIEGV